jgi:hypothetical protein
MRVRHAVLVSCYEGDEGRGGSNAHHFDGGRTMG